MKFVIQRVLSAQVDVDGKCIGSIERGFLVFIGIGKEDTKEVADHLIHKLTALRIFEDESGKTNLSLTDVGGNLLLVSQFTLYADCKKGNRPSFILAGEPEKSEYLYDYIVTQCQLLMPGTQHGKFGADMKVSLVNDGPFTILYDSDQM